MKSKEEKTKIIHSVGGRQLQVEIFGGSHEEEIGVRIFGLPKSFSAADIDWDALGRFLARRAPGSSLYGTPRKEADRPQLQGEDPLCFVIKNTNTRSADYAALRELPRPGHADLTARIKYGDKVNMAGGGPFSGRMTAPLCIAGGLALQILEKKGIRIHAALMEAGGVAALPATLEAIRAWEQAPEEEALREAMETAQKEDPLYREILAAKEAGDSVGGLVHGEALGLPPGIGGPLFDGLESYLSPLLFGIPGVKGLSFGEGFAATSMRGSEHNDPYIMEDNPTFDLRRIRCSSNHAGGILGGISNGMPLTLDVAFKPTASIALPQQSIDLGSGQPATLRIQGRHDPCIAVRAVPVVEAAMALGILDAMLDGEEV